MPEIFAARAAARAARAACLFLTLALAGGCTGLVAGRESSASLIAPASRDSAWARVKRAMTTEVFTVEAQDSLAGRISATRYPSPGTKVGSNVSCRLRVSLALEPRGADSTAISGRGLWTVYKAGRDSSRAVAPCDRELAETMGRLQQAALPTP